jgi:hypothetical protein
MFESPSRLLLGLVTGLVFGFLLQRGQVSKYRVIVGQFLLRDWTVVKIMGTAVLVGSIGVYALVQTGQASLHIKPAALGGLVFGGLAFGVGMAILGYCPGTGVAACGQGSRDAMVGVLGMIAGSFAYVPLFPAWRSVETAWGSWGRTTIPEVTGTSPWIWIGALGVAAVAAALWAERAGRATRAAPGSD